VYLTLDHRARDALLLQKAFCQKVKKGELKENETPQTCIIILKFKFYISQGISLSELRKKLQFFIGWELFCTAPMIIHHWAESSNSE